jgi:hypothetical protein
LDLGRTDTIGVAQPCDPVRTQRHGTSAPHCASDGEIEERPHGFFDDKIPSGRVTWIIRDRPLSFDAPA